MHTGTQHEHAADKHRREWEGGPACWSRQSGPNVLPSASVSILAREAASLQPCDTIQETKNAQRLLCEHIYNVYSKVSKRVSGIAVQI